MSVDDTEDYTEAVIIKGSDGAYLVTLLTDSDGRILAVMKGDYSGTLKTVKVNDAGELIAILKGASGYNLAVDANGYMTATIKGEYDSTPTTVKLDADGHIIAVMKGEYNGALQTVALDSDHRMIARSIMAPDKLIGNSNNEISTGSTVSVDSDPVPTGKYWKITALYAMNETSFSRSISLMRKVNIGLGYYWRFRRVKDLPPLVSVEWNGEMWIDEAECIRAYFSGILNGDSCILNYFGYEISKV